jgi:hypothetical protein
MIGLLLAMLGTSWAASADVESVEKAPSHPEWGITMTGRCPNGEAFRLLAYEKPVDGVWKSFYDYQGPVGVGTVITRTVPQVMARRVCIALAEIASDEL